MTREEAIRRLKNMAWLYGSAEREPHIEAIDMAIEALQAEYEDYEHATLVDIKEPLKVSVVRCKDCKASRVYGKTTQWLACESVMEGQATDPNGYCYLGERKKP